MLSKKLGSKSNINVKKLLLLILLLPTFVFSQKNTNKFYGNASLFYKHSLTLTKSPPVGGAIVGGAKFSNIGVGLGLEAFKIESKYAMAFPIFIDIRYFFKQKEGTGKSTVLPFVAFNIGKLLWNTSFSNNTGLDNTIFYYKGRSIVNFEIGMHLNQKQKKQSVYLAAGFKYLASNYYAENTNSYRVDPGGVIVIGTPVVTRYPTQIIQNKNLYIKVGYQF